MPETCSIARGRFVQHLTETAAAQHTHTHPAFSMQKTSISKISHRFFVSSHELSHAEENEELPPDTVSVALRCWQLGTKQTATVFVDSQRLCNADVFGSPLLLFGNR